MKNRKRQKGTTMIELVIVIVIITVLGAGGIELFRFGYQSYILRQNIIEANWQGRVALSRMERDLHTVRSSGDITTATSSAIAFTDESGDAVSYQLSGTNLMRNTQILADHVKALTFKYYNVNGTELTSPINASAVRYVAITLNIKKVADYNVTTGVALWNII